jgi:hypothetical protein
MAKKAIISGSNLFNFTTIERFLQYKRDYASENIFSEKLEKWKKEKPFFVLGTYSATELKKEKLIKLEATKQLPDIEEPLTRSEIAKAILETLPERKRYIFPFSKKDFELMKDNFAGQYARIGKYTGEFVYIDIKSFYFSVYSFFLGVEYRRNTRFGIRKHLQLTQEQIEFLSADKALRNTLFGIMRNHTRTVIKEGKALIQQSHNKFLNPQLANLTYDMSKAIMYKAIIEFGAIYWNTDGGIFPIQTAEAFTQFIKSLGLKAGIKAHWRKGVVIKGIGIYGGFSPLEPQTLHFERVKYPETHEGEIRTNLDLDVEEVDFLLRKWRFWLERLG